MRILAFVLCSCAALLGCDEDPFRRTVVECRGAVSCDTADCYSECVCERGDASACEAQCPAQGVRVADLDEDAWTDDWIAREGEVVSLTNAARKQGGCCGDEGCFDPAPPLEVEPALRRSARSHAFDMVERRYFAHESPDGLSPFDRMREAGFRGCGMGENIAAGQPTAADVVRGWRESPGHCANMLSPSFDRIGVGYHPSAQRNMAHVWVQNFGAL